MQKLIILRGNSGSGKTTVAKLLQNRFGRNTMLISQDVIRRDMLKAKDGQNTEALGLLKELLKYGYHHSTFVILEGIMCAEWYNPLFKLAVQLYGTQIYAFYFDLPFEETLRRHKTKQNHGDFGEKEMREWWKEKDFSDVLNEIAITADESTNYIVEKIYSIVSSDSANKNTI